MKLKIISITILGLLFCSLAILYKGYSSMNSFNHEKTELENLSNLINSSNIKYYDYKIKIEEVETAKVEIKLNGISPPIDSQISLYSNVLNETIYAGNYKDKIIVEIPTSLYKQDMGLDSIKFSIYSPETSDMYTLEQEKPYVFWLKDSIVNVNFLSEKEYYNKEFALFIGYTVTLDSIDNKSSLLE